MSFDPNHVLLKISEATGRIEAKVDELKQDQEKLDIRVKAVEDDVKRAKTIAGFVGTAAATVTSAVAWIASQWRVH